MFVNLKEKTCTVIGGGVVALRKILGLLECHASVRVISPTSAQQIIQLNHQNKIDLFERAYQRHDLVGSFLVVAATDDAEVNQQIAQECTELNILCNVVDHPNLCNFYYASVYTRGDLKIAISTNGISPALARKMKSELSEIYPEAYIPYLKYLRKMRETVKVKIPDASKRKAILEQIIDTPDILEQFKHTRVHRNLDNIDFVKELEKWS